MLWITTVEDGAVYASLSAAGWSDSRVALAIVSQAGMTGMIGAVAATGLSIGIVAYFTQATPQVVLTHAGIAAAYVMAPILVSLIPARIHLRQPLHHLLTH
ncbi:hypothetical protein I6E29_04570 [Arcanobacterium haemolyticum]|nr:hypothetical protein [Arcanobacterium haemolyticum]